MAVQRRQQVRAALDPGRSRRRARPRRLRPSGRRPLDPPDVSSQEADAAEAEADPPEHELEDGRTAGRLRQLRPAVGRHRRDPARDARASELRQAVRTSAPGESLPAPPARALLVRRLVIGVRPPFASSRVAGPPLHGAGVGGGRATRVSPRPAAGSRASSKRGCGEPFNARNAGCQAERSSSRSRCSTASGPTGRSRHRAVGATGTSSCPMRSRPGSSNRTARRRKASSPTSAGTAPACSDACGQARTASTGLPPTRSPARAPCTD